MSDIWFKRYLVAWLLLFNYAFDVMRSLFGILNWNTMLTNMCIWCDMYVGTSIIWLWVNEHSASKSMPLCLEIENSYCSGGWSVIFLCILNSAIFCCSRRYEEQLRHVHLLVTIMSYNNIFIRNYINHHDMLVTSPFCNGTYFMALPCSFISHHM